METDTITVRLLGGFSVRCGDRSLASLPPQPVSLLSYLIVNRERPQTRDLLAGRFWPELPDDRARKRLSNCLWMIKSAFEEAELPPLLVTSSSTIEVASGFSFEVDAEEFEARLAEFERELRHRQVRGVLTDRLAEVVGNYPGDFLSGHYHDWIEPERERIRDRYHAALNQLITLYKSRSQYDIALRFAHVLVGQDPLREELHREVMRLHALLDEPSAAERQFEACRRVLESELGIEPSVETVELLERIRTDAPGPRTGPVVDVATPPTLVGRGHELSVLLGRAEEVLRGSGGVVLVEGDPGIGKTRLIEEYVEAADWRGVRVLRASSTRLSKLRPYEVLKAVLAPAVAGLRGEHLAEVVEPVWLQQAAEVLPGIERLVDGASPRRPLRPEEEPTRMSEALARIVLAQGGLGPTLIVLEDVHWCDDDSMQVMVQLGARLARSGVLVCMTYRRFEAEQSDSVWAGISKLEAMPSASRLVLGPLSGAEVRELIMSHLGPGGLPTGAMTQVVEVTGGNPLYVLESVRNPTTLLGRLDDPDPGDALAFPAAVARSLEDRVEALDPPLRTVLEALAALAEPALPKLVAEITGLDRLAAVESLAGTVDQGFVQDDDDDGSCQFAHDQTRRVVYELMSAERQREVHDRIFEVLGGLADPQPAQLAHHGRMAGRMVEARRWHLEAARHAASVNGYRTAADHFGQADEAAREAGIDVADRARDLLAYEVTLDVLGQRSEQTMLLKRLREVDLPLPVELELAEREVWLLLNSDEPDEAVRLAMASLERAKAAGQPHVGLWTTVAVARYRAGDFLGAIEPAEDALAAATTPAERIAALTILGKAQVDLVRFEEGGANLAKAMAEAEGIGDDRGRIEALNYLAASDFGLGSYQEAEARFTEALKLSRELGYRWGEGTNLINLASFHTVRGHGGEALQFFEEASEIMGSLGNGRGEAFIKMNSAELYHRLLGDDDTAAELASSAAMFFRSVGEQHRECLTMALLSSVDRRRGKRRLARRRLNDLLARASAAADTIGEVAVRRNLASLDVDAGDHRGAAEHLDGIQALAERFPLEHVMPNVLATRAMVASELGDQDRAGQLVDRALGINMAGSEVPHITAWTAGMVLVALDREDEATEQFGLAYELLTASLRGLPPELVDRSLSTVPEHVAIVEAYQRRFALVMEARLPLIEAPLGRPLRADEFVDVQWTVWDPADWSEPSVTERRRRRLVRLIGQALEQGALARIGDLAGVLSVSDRTVKRDLSDLRAAGTVLRTRRSV